MNPDFQIIEATRKVEGGVESLSRVMYQNVGIANIVHSFIPSEKGIAKGKKPIAYSNGTAQDYIRKFGFLAEHRRRWNLKDFDVGVQWVNWNDSMLVDTGL